MCLEKTTRRIRKLVWYVEVEFPGKARPNQGSAVLVETISRLEANFVRKYLLTCLHVACDVKVTSSGTSYIAPNEIRCWPPGSGYSRDMSNAYRAKVSQLRPLPVDRQDALREFDDWVLLEIEDPEFRDFSVENVWATDETTIPFDGMILVGYPDGDHGFQKNGKDTFVANTPIFNLARSRPLSEFTFQLDTNDPMPGMSGGGCFSSDGVFIGLHRAARVGAIKRTEIRIDRIAGELAKKEIYPYWARPHGLNMQLPKETMRFAARQTMDNKAAELAAELAAALTDREKSFIYMKYGEFAISGAETILRDVLVSEESAIVREGAKRGLELLMRSSHLNGEHK